MRTATMILAALLAATPAFASDEEILALYEENGRAWAEGRLDDADRAGEAAWRMAEAEWGGVEDTALLADNLVRQRIAQGDRVAAREPAQRVRSLVEEGVAPSIIIEEARLAVAISEFDPEAPTPETTAAIQAALDAAEEMRLPPSQLIWTGWLDIARGQLTSEDWEGAFKAGANVMNVMDLSTGVPDSARIEAALISGMAALETEAFADAARSLNWAMSYLPREISVGGEEVINPGWALLGAWQGYASMIHASRGEEDLVVGSDIFGLDDMKPEAFCPSVEWIRRDPPQYPERAASEGIVGAVMVEFELAPDGSTTAVRTLADVPAGRLSGAAEDAARGWRADPETLTDCVGRKMVTQVQFMICTEANCGSGRQLTPLMRLRGLE